MSHEIMQKKGDAHYATRLNKEKQQQRGKDTSADTQWSLQSETCSFMMPDSSVSMSR